MTRADQLLLAQGLAESRTQAQKMIAAGRVSYLQQGQPVVVAKAGQDLPSSCPLRLAADPADRYVSRGGLKLAGALAHRGIAVTGWTVLDIGQSTGGFTDCLLQAGAARVVGIEVGHGQLHARLRADPRVVCLEGVNARRLVPADLGEHWPERGFDLLVTDASFISLTLLLPGYPALLRPGGRVLALVKPQFEVGPEGIGKGGIVRDAARYVEVEHRIRDACRSVGLQVEDFFPSAITGGDGNREFFVYATLPDTRTKDLNISV